MKRVEITVKGLVQGVSYRYNTYNVAIKLGVSGTVKNLKDGSVHVVAEGPKDTLLELIDWCKEGPRYARVDRFYIEWSEPEGGFDNTFKVID